MTQYVFNATDTNVLDDFTHRGGPENLPSIETAPDGRTCIEWNFSFVRTPQFWSYDPAGTTATIVDFVALLSSAEDGSRPGCGIVSHASGVTGTSDGLRGAHGSTYDSNRIITSFRGATEGGEIPANLGIDNSQFRYHRVRAEHTGSNEVRIQHRTWAEGESEPSTWVHDSTWTNADADGYVGLYLNGDGPHRYIGGVFTDDGSTADVTQIDTQEGAATTPGIPATTLENADGTLSTGTAVTRTITRVSDSTELFTGAQTSDATTGELPEIDLSGTDAEVNQDINDEVVLDTVPASGVVSTTVRRTVGDLGA